MKSVHLTQDDIFVNNSINSSLKTLSWSTFLDERNSGRYMMRQGSFSTAGKNLMKNGRHTVIYVNCLIITQNTIFIIFLCFGGKK